MTKRKRHLPVSPQLLVSDLCTYVVGFWTLGRFSAMKHPLDLEDASNRAEKLQKLASFGYVPPELLDCLAIG